MQQSDKGYLIKLKVTDAKGNMCPAGLPINGVTNMYGGQVVTTGKVILCTTKNTQVNLTTTTAYADLPVQTKSLVLTEAITEITWVMTPQSGSKTYTTNSTVTFSPFATTMDICCVGGGGGSGYGHTEDDNRGENEYWDYYGSGAGAGSVTNLLNKTITPLQQYAITIGTAGTGQTSSKSATSGGSTTVKLNNNVVLSASGGSTAGGGAGEVNYVWDSGSANHGSAMKGADTTTYKYNDPALGVPGGGSGGGAGRRGGADGGKPYGGKGGSNATGYGGGAGGGGCNGYQGVAFIRWNVM